MYNAHCKSLTVMCQIEFVTLCIYQMSTTFSGYFDVLNTSPLCILKNFFDLNGGVFGFFSLVK